MESYTSVRSNSTVAIVSNEKQTNDEQSDMDTKYSMVTTI